MTCAARQSTLAGDFTQFSDFHFHFAVWKLNKELSDALSDLPSTFQDFWTAAIVEFHLYYLQPLLGSTTCNGGPYESIVGLDRHSLTANGLALEGIRTSTRTPSSLEITRANMARAAWGMARYAFGLKQLQLSAPNLDCDADLAVWAAAPSFLTSMKKVLGDAQNSKTLYLVNQFSAAAGASELMEGLHIHLVQHEVAALRNLIKIHEWLGKAARRVSCLSYSCREHGVQITGRALSDLFLNFVATRWPAYLGFFRSASLHSSELRNIGVSLLILNQERNIRERVWCQEMKRAGIRTVAVQTGLIAADPLWSYRIEADSMLVDSTFTATEFLKMGHSGDAVHAVGYPGNGIFRELKLSEPLREVRLRALRLPLNKRIIFFATQNVSEVSPGAVKRKDATLERIKANELRDMIRLARLHNFQLVLKPHRAEDPAFYERRLRSDDPVTLFPKEQSPYELISVSDGIVTRWSTVAYEAMAAGKPVFFLNYYHYMPRFSCFRERWADVARHSEETEGRFATYWDHLNDPGFSGLLQDWMASQGWDTGADQRIRERILDQAFRQN